MERLEGARQVARAIRLPAEGGGWATAALLELSRAIPDSARVESLELSARGGTLGLRAAGDAPVDELLLAVPGLRRAPPSEDGPETPAGREVGSDRSEWPLIPLDWKRTDGPV